MRIGLFCYLSMMFPMEKTISATEARIRFVEVIRRAADRHERFVPDRSNRIVAILNRTRLTRCIMPNLDQ